MSSEYSCVSCDIIRLGDSVTRPSYPSSDLLLVPFNRMVLLLTEIVSTAGIWRRKWQRVELQGWQVGDDAVVIRVPCFLAGDA